MRFRLLDTQATEQLRAAADRGAPDPLIEARLGDRRQSLERYPVHDAGDAQAGAPLEPSHATLGHGAELTRPGEEDRPPGCTRGHPQGDEAKSA